jgi:hypothetical protein
MILVQLREPGAKVENCTHPGEDFAGDFGGGRGSGDVDRDVGGVVWGRGKRTDVSCSCGV